MSIPVSQNTAAHAAAPLLMTTTDARQGEKRPATTMQGWHYDAAWFPAGQHRPWGEPGTQLADVYARHTLVFALDLDLYKPDKAAAWEASATRAWTGNRPPYIRRGTAGSQRYLVAMTPELAAKWWPVASGMPWGDLRSSGIAPSPGARHPSGDAYEPVPGPDPVRYPLDGTVVWTNVLYLDEAGIAALEADGAHNRDDRPVTAGDAELPDDDGRCPLVASWLENRDFTGATPRGERANAAVNYLKRLDAEGHHVGGWIDMVLAALPETSTADFESMWASAPVLTGTVTMEHGCCGDPLGLNAMAAAQLRAGNAEADSLDAVFAHENPEFAANGQQQQPVNFLAGIRTGKFLNETAFDPLHYHVDGLVPEGFTLLVAAPKTGKSWLVLGWLLDLARQGKAVLYLALEDSDRRMQWRCRSLLGDAPVPESFCYLTEEVLVAGGVLQAVGQFAYEHRDRAPLIVLDTLGKAQQYTPRMRDESQYDRDYRVTSWLQQTVRGCPGAGLVVCHHDRKATSEDFLDKASGTRGVTGGPDTIMLLLRPRNEAEGTLMLTGRDIAEAEYAMTHRDGKWELEGGTLQAAAAALIVRRARNGLSDRQADVVAFVTSQGDKGAGAAEVAMGTGISIEQARVYLKRAADGGRLKRTARGLYMSVSYVISPAATPPSPTGNNTNNTFSSPVRAGARAREGSADSPPGFTPLEVSPEQRALLDKLIARQAEQQAPGSVPGATGPVPGCSYCKPAEGYTCWPHRSGR